MNLTMLDYKGKYFTLQDEGMELDDIYDYPIGTMTKEQVLEPSFVADHAEACRYYGIPPYYGKDKDLSEVYDRAYEKLESEDDE